MQLPSLTAPARRAAALAAALGLAVAGASAWAQPGATYLEVGLRGGIMNYQGDVQPGLFAAAGNRVSYGGLLRYSIGNKLALRAQVEAGEIAATDAENDNERSRTRGISFEAPVVAAELLLEVLPLGQDRYSNGYTVRQLNPFAYVGAGYAHVDAEVASTNGFFANRLPEVGDHDDFLTVAVGGGLRYDIDYGLAVTAEGITRAMLSDYADGVSENGNPLLDDWVWSLGLTVSYTFD